MSKTTAILTGTASDIGPGAPVPGGTLEPANPILLASNVGDGTVLPPNWTAAFGATNCSVQVNAGFDAGKAIRIRRAAGYYAPPPEIDPVQLDPANCGSPIIHCPTWLYWEFDFMFDSNFLANTNAWNGNGALKNIYTLITNIDYRNSVGSGQWGAFDATIGEQCDISLSQSPVPPHMIYGATNLVQSYVDPYTGTDIILRGYLVPDAVINGGDLTHVFSASNAFQHFMSDGTTPIDNGAQTIASYPAPPNTVNGLPATIIKTWINAGEIELASAAPNAISGPMGVGGSAPFTGNQAQYWYPNVPTATPSPTTIQDKCKFVAGTKRRVEWLQVANTDNNTDGLLQVAIDGVLVANWNVKHSTLMGRWWTTYFDQQTPFGASTTLSGAILAGDTTITVGTTATFPASGAVMIESEIIPYASKNATQFLTCTRGGGGTTAAGHANGTAVYQAINVANFDTWLGRVRVSCGYYRAGEAPKQYTMTADHPSYAPNAAFSITAQLDDFNGNPVRSSALSLKSVFSAQGSGGTCSPVGDFGSGGSTDGYGVQVYTGQMPSGHGESITLTVSDQAIPARTGTITLTTT